MREIRFAIWFSAGICLSNFTLGKSADIALVEVFWVFMAMGSYAIVNKLNLNI